MKKLGVVVPIYNAELYLRQCIESILNQTYQNISVVLVNDGSTDNSGRICDEYAKKDKRVQVIHQNNQGKLFSRYIGIESLKCDYATFVDADDWIEKYAYERIIKYIDMRIDMISFKIIRYFDETYQYVSQNNYAEGLYDKQKIIDKIYPTMIWDIQKNSFGLDPSLCNKVIRRELLLDALYEARNLKISYGDDVAVTYPLVRQIDSIMITEEELYFHRQRDEKKIADYLVDEEYYKKLYSLYEYLVRKFQDNKEMVRQIDYFYATSTRYHLRIYGEKKAGQNYLFPFDKVQVNKRVVIYGASVLGQIYYQQFSQINYGTIVAWIDRNYEAYKDLGVKAIEYIQDVGDFDYVVIAVVNSETAKTIKNNLIGMNIDEKKIIWNIK